MTNIELTNIQQITLDSLARQGSSALDKRTGDALVRRGLAEPATFPGGYKVTDLGRANTSHARLMAKIAERSEQAARDAETERNRKMFDTYRWLSEGASK